MLHELYDTTFESYISSVSFRIPVLVDFYGDGCAPCIQMQYILESISQRYIGFKFCKINVSRNPTIQRKYDIMSIPTLKLFINGQVVDTMIGNMRGEAGVLSFMKVA